MRVLLLHNPTAGESTVAAPDLTGAFQDAGHDVRYRSTEPSWQDALDGPFDVVVVAGGDGTVREAAIALVDHHRNDLPLSIVPTGVANNIARSLRSGVGPQEIAVGLNQARRVRLPIGSARAPWGSQRFVESAGVGLAPLLEGPVEPTIAAGAARLQRLLETARLQHITVEVDGRDASGEYYLVLAINTRSIGPQLELVSPTDAAHPSLRVLLVGESERAMLSEALTRICRGERGTVPLSALPAGEVVVGWLKGQGHLDDAAWPGNGHGDGRVTLIIETTLPVLVPDTPHPARSSA